ncbi:hypothetical protein AB6E04_01110 [Vibrio amylolyticus]|uniref:hypothetical protein n=1 Tax=Vibrio amylolyticus TaxID=2847292 RepID=UPI00354FCA4D
MGYEEDYFKAPEGLPEREIRALFSELSNHVLWEAQSIKRDREVIAILKSLLNFPRYQVAHSHIKKVLETDYQNTCLWWEEEYRYTEAWPHIAPLLDEF